MLKALLLLCFAAMLVHLAAFSLPCLTWQVVFLRTVRKLKRHKSMKMRSDKCKKGGFDSFFVVFVAYESLLQWAVKFGACLRQSSAILVHSWGISFSMLARFAQCWGSVGASRGGMLEVIGAVGSMLKALLLLCHLFCVHLAAFSLPFDLGR